MTSLQLKPSPVHYPPTTRHFPFRLFDIAVATDFSFQNKFPPATAPPDLYFTCRLEPPLSIQWDAVTPLFTSREQTSDGTSLFLLFAAENCVMLRFSRIADFYLWSDTIVCYLIDPACDHLVEIYFLGMVLACWFELQGVLALHAAASVVNGRAVAFLSGNQGGKTSLAATFMQQGYPLLTDDILLVEQQDGPIVGRSGYPQMRLWPEQAEMLFGRSQEFSLVHPYLDKRRVPVDFDAPGLFQSGRFPISRFYIPERYTPDNEPPEITITPLPPVEALLKLAGYSFLFWLVEAIGLQPRRLKRLAQVVETVTVSQLRYPGGVEHLPAVCRAVLADLQLPITNH
jgi:hypothetical protein